MEVVLVLCNSESKYFDLYIPDPAMAQLAGMAKQAGHRCTLFDLNQLDLTPEDVVRYVEQHRPEIVGFKLWLDGFISLDRLAHAVKLASPRTLTVAGGPHARLFREAIFNVTDAFDVLCYEEGDYTIVQLLEYLSGQRRLDQVCNIIYRHEGQCRRSHRELIEDLDRLPLPDWTTIDMSRYFPIALFNMMRGCPFQCAFCCHNYLWGLSAADQELAGKTRQELQSMRLVRHRSFEKMCQELSVLLDTYGIRVFNLVDSTPNIQYLHQLCDWLIAAQRQTHWTSFGRIRYFDYALMSKLKRAGWMGVWFGIESGSPRMLDRMGKLYSREEIQQSVQQAKQAGIDIVIGSFLTGFPGEDEHSIRETQSLIDDLPLDVVVISPFVLEPGSPVALNPQAYGLVPHADWLEKMIRVPEGTEWHDIHCYEIDGMSNVDWWQRFEHFSGYQGRDVDRQIVESDVANMIAPYLNMTGVQFMTQVDAILKREDHRALRALQERAWTMATS